MPAFPISCENCHRTVLLNGVGVHSCNGKIARRPPRIPRAWYETLAVSLFLTLAPALTIALLIIFLH